MSLYEAAKGCADEQNTESEFSSVPCICLHCAFPSPSPLHPPEQRCLTSLSSALELLHLSSGHRMSKPQFLPLYHARVSKYLAVQNICLIPLIQYILLLPTKRHGQIFLNMHGYGITPSPSMPTAKCNLSPNCFRLPSPLLLIVPHSMPLITSGGDRGHLSEAETGLVSQSDPHLHAPVHSAFYFLAPCKSSALLHRFPTTFVLGS